MEKATENGYSVYATDQSEQGWTNILIALLIVALTLAVFLFVKRKHISRRGVCLIGLCDSGKTLLFSQLIYKKALESFTSMQENKGILHIDQKKPLEIIDIPGHERVRQRYFDAHKSSARGIIYTIDSLNFTKDIRDVAEYLYNILLDPVIIASRPRLLIFCNKQDYPLAKGKQVIKSQLEKEMNVLRTTKANQLQATSDSGDIDAFLGEKGKDFEFSDLRSLKIEFAMGSVQTNEMDEVTKWIHTIS